MNDLAVARGNAIADTAGRLGDDHVVAAARCSASDGKSDDPGADDQYLHGFRPCCLYSKRESQRRVTDG